MRYIEYLLGGILLVGAGTSSQAQGIHSSRPLEGYECKMLNITGRQLLSQKTQVPVRAGPNPDAAIVGIAPGTIAVKSPATPQNGFLQAINASGRTVWIAADSVRDYHSEGDPSATCVPSVMSNGLIGFRHPAT